MTYFRVELVVTEGTQGAFRFRTDLKFAHTVVHVNEPCDLGHRWSAFDVTRSCWMNVITHGLFGLAVCRTQI